MKNLNYPCDEKDCSKVNFEEDVKEIKELLIKNYTNCFKKDNVKAWLDGLKYDDAMKAFDKNIKQNLAKKMAKKQTPWEKSKVTQEEVKTFVEKNDDKISNEKTWKAFRDKVQKLLDDEYKKDDRLLRQRVLQAVQSNKTLIATSRRLHFVGSGSQDNNTAIKKQ